MTEKVNNILEYSAQVEQYEKERTEAIREKILSRFAELKAEPDQSRVEQEMFMKSDIPNLIEPLSQSNLTEKELLLSKYSDQSIDFERILYICR